MSRCFPFPPPGYEERLRPEENLLKEEKRRDKKLKREKKDKEKREGKEKRKGEKGDGKHREKKDKKVKHRDKKEKHKDKKDKKDEGNTRNDNEKSSISEDASIVREPETRSTEKVHTGEVCFVEKGWGVNKTKGDSLCQLQDEQESIDHSLDRDTVESKFLPKFGRIRNEVRATGSTLGKSSTAYSTGNEEMHKSALADLQRLAEVKARNGDRRADGRQEEGQALQDRAQFSGTVMVRGLARSVDIEVEGMPGSVHNNGNRIVQGMLKCQEDGYHKRGEQSKCKDKKETKNHGTDKGSENEKKLKERTDHKLSDQERSKIFFNNGSPGVNNSYSYLLAVDNKVVSTEENLKKRKNVERKGSENEKKLKERTDQKSSDQERSKIFFSNGSPRVNNSNSYLSAVDTKVVSTEGNVIKRKNVESKGHVHENGISHNKVPRVTLYLPKDNGQITRQPLGLPNSDRNCIPPQAKVGIKNGEVPGTIDAPSSYIHKQMPPSASATSCQLMKGSIKASPTDKVVKASSELPQASLVVGVSVKPPLVAKVIKMSRRSSQACQVVEGSKKYHQFDEFTEPSRKLPHPDMMYPSQIPLVPENWEVSGTVDSPSSIYKQMPPLASATSCQLMEDSILASPADELVKAELPQASLVVEASVKPPLVSKVIKTSKRSPQSCQVVEGSKKCHQVDEFAEPSRKSPHPDMKYLSKVLLIPERKEWSEVNDEHWLFSGKDPSFLNQKHDASASCDYGQQHVWSESLHMETADIYALPYVIPY